MFLTFMNSLLDVRAHHEPIAPITGIESLCGATSMFASRASMSSLPSFRFDASSIDNEENAIWRKCSNER